MQSSLSIIMPFIKSSHATPVSFIIVIFCYYRPQTNFAKVMFLYVSVCPQGGVPGQVPPRTRYTPHLGQGTTPLNKVHPQDRVHPRAGTLPQAGTPPRPGTPRTRYTSQVGTPPGQVHPQTRYPSRTRYPPGPGTCPRQVPPSGTSTPPKLGKPPWDQVHPLGAVHAGRYGQQAGGTHPIGMHSCS